MKTLQYLEHPPSSFDTLAGLGQVIKVAGIA